MVIEDLRKPSSLLHLDNLIQGCVYEDPVGNIIFVTDESEAIFLGTGLQWPLTSRYDDESTFKALKAKLVIENE